MARAAIGGRGADSTIINSIVNILAAGLRLAQLCFDFESDGGSSEMVFQSFLLMDKSVTCFKLFISAYHQVHAEGVGMLAVSCLFGLSIHLFTIVIHLYVNHRSRARAWMCCMAILLATGVFMLAMKIPEDYAWHTTAAEAILDLFICLEAVLLITNKMSEHGGNENLLRELLLISADTVINVCLFSDYLVQTHGRWDAEKILHLYGSCLSMVIGLGQIGWITYKAYNNRILTGRGEQATGAAVDRVGDGDIEQQMVQEGVELVEEEGSKTPQHVLLFGKTPRVFTREIKMSAGAAIEDDGGGDEGEKVPAEEDVEATVRHRPKCAVTDVPISQDWSIEIGVWSLRCPHRSSNLTLRDTGPNQNEMKRVSCQHRVRIVFGWTDR